MRTHNIISLASTLALGLVSTSAALAKDYDKSNKPAQDDEKYIEFKLDRSPGIVKAQCLPYATGKVRVTSKGPVEVMDVELDGLPANLEMDAFVIQVPNAPFGLSWYQGDINADEYGHAKAQFIGRFNIETFIVAPGVTKAPQVHDEPFPDAEENPQTAPVHTYHFGVWFNSADDAKAAGCPDTVTPFNGEHNAGVQLFNTGSFPDLEGPLSKIES